MKKHLSHGLPVVGGAVGGTFSRWLLLWLLARYAGGASSVGAYAAILAFATPVFVAASLGLRTIYLSAQARWSWRSYVLLRVCGVLVGVGVIILLAIFNSASWRGYGALLVAIVSMKVSDAVLDLQLARVQLQLGLRHLGTLEIVNAVITVLLCIAVALLWGNAALIVYASAASSLGVALLALWLNRSAPERDKDVAGSGVGWILRTSVPVTASQFLAAMLLQVPILVVAVHGTVDQVGAFAVAAYFITLMNLLGGVLQTIAITPLRGYWASSRVKFAWGLRRFLGAAILLGAVASVTTAIAGDAMVTWIYGEGFTIGRMNFAIIGCALIFVPVAFVLSAALNVLNEYRRVTSAVLSAFVVVLVIAVAGTLGQANPVLLACIILLAGGAVRAVCMYHGKRRATLKAAAP